MSADLSAEAEHLLVDLAVSEFAIDRHRERLNRRQMEIAEPLAKEWKSAPADERPAQRERLGATLSELRRTTYRSELAHLAAELVRELRRRAMILRKLDAFPQLGESVPAVDIAVEYDGERGFIIRTGGGRVHRFTLPAVIDRGVWRTDGRYERGDAVTSDGSLWIAKEDNPAHEPGKGPQWRLAVMRGRNGRDANRTRTA